MSLNEVRENTDAIINELKGDARFISRITSIGLTPGCRVSIIKNDKNRPVLLYSRETMIAVNRKECAGILVSEVKACAPQQSHCSDSRIPANPRCSMR